MIYIGTSGWSYEHWNGILYPASARPWQRIHHYVRQFNTAELNSSFYRWPGDESFKRWNKKLPQDFQLSVKAPRLLTHVKRLYQPESWIRRIQSSWHELRDRRAVLLVQISPTFPCDYQRLAYFLEQLPGWVKVAFEFRHPGWHRDDIFQLLEKHDASYCIMSGACLPCILKATSSLVYIRMHGPGHHHLYTGSYADTDLLWWRDRILEWDQQGKNVYVYFNNDGHGYAVHNAIRLKNIVLNNR